MKRLTTLLRLTLMSLWTFVAILAFFPIIILRMRDPNLFRDFLAFVGPLALKILGVRVILEGPQAPELTKIQPCIFIGNHQTGLDLISYGMLGFSRTVAVGKRELLYVPFLGFIFWATGCVMINRKKSAQAIQQISEVAKQIHTRKVSLCIFPEGTRNRVGQGFLPFKKGAFHIAIGAQVPLVPMVCEPIDKIIDRKRGTITPGTIRIRVLEPVPTQGLGPQDVDRILALCQERMKQTYEELGRS